MLTLLKTKVALLVLGAIAFTGVAGTATVVVAQHHAGPFAPGGIFGAQHPSQDASATKTPDGKTFHAQGIIQSVTWDAGKTSGSLTFVPNGTTAPVTVRFTAQTHVEVSADIQSGTTTTHGQVGVVGLQVGMAANIVGTLQPDGTVLAQEIQANANGKAHQGGDGATPTPNPGNGHHDGTPTPHPGNGHHDGTPTPTPSQ